MYEVFLRGRVVDLKEAGEASILAGRDMGMESRAYVSDLKTLVEEWKIPERYIDDVVRRILFKKFQLGLFDDPFAIVILNGRYLPCFVICCGRCREGGA